MSLPIPPKYVVLPQACIEQAYADEKPRKALLATFIRLISLAWQSKYQQTPALREEELFDMPDQPGFLRLSRRQYFEQKAEMEHVGWLRSSHPRPGFVQFSFSRELAALSEQAAQEAGAENRTDVRKTAPVLKRMEEDESLINLNTESSSSIPQLVRKTAPVRKTALSANSDSEKLMLALIENLPLLFDPETFGGPLDMRENWLYGIPDYALGWIAKAYKERDALVRGGGALGLIVNGLNGGTAPHRWYMTNASKLLTDDYLEATGLKAFECLFCVESFATRALRDAHQLAMHRHRCEECGADFQDAETLKTHWDQEHDPYRVQGPLAVDVIHAPALDGSIETVWQTVLSRLQQDMPRASFETWVRDCTPLRYDGNTVIAFARNAYARDWLADRLTARVNALLSQLLEKPTTVVFTNEELA